MPATLQFDLPVGGSARRREGTTAKLLLLGDFGARAHRGLADPATLATRPAPAVDVDSLDAAVARFAPRVQATLDDGTAVDLSFRSLDDFHPDRLATAHPPLAALLQLRRRLLDPAQFAAAAAELGAVVSQAAGSAGGGAAAGTSGAAREDDQAMIDRLLGGARVGTFGSRASLAASTVDALVRRIVGVNDLAPELKFQPQYLAAVQDPAAAQLRALLHLAAFQSLEAAWRGVQLLVQRLDLGDELELHLFDVTLDELRADAAQAGGDVQRSALARRLRQLAAEAADGEASWLAVGGLFSFGAGDIDLLAAIAAATRAAGVPFVAGVDASIAGTIADATDWQPPEPAVMARWRALRGSGIAASTGLAAPRILLRLPYGQAQDAVDCFPFEELAATAPSAGELLWGEPAIAALLVLARANEADPLAIDDLPALTFTADGERKLQPCAEWLMGERLAVQLSEHGLMPLLGSRHRNAVRLAGWRTIAAD